MMRLAFLAVLALYVLAVIEILRSNKDSEKKTLWIVVIIFLPILGLVLYYLMDRRK